MQGMAADAHQLFTCGDPHMRGSLLLRSMLRNASKMYAGDSVYGEKRISVEGEKEGEKIEYRVWNPFRLAMST